jgi:hypothetical protein
MRLTNNWIQRTLTPYAISVLEFPDLQEEETKTLAVVQDILRDALADPEVVADMAVLRRYGGTAFAGLIENAALPGEFYGGVVCLCPRDIKAAAAAAASRSPSNYFRISEYNGCHRPSPVDAADGFAIEVPYRCVNGSHIIAGRVEKYLPSTAGRLLDATTAASDACTAHRRAFEEAVRAIQAAARSCRTDTKLLAVWPPLQGLLDLTGSANGIEVSSNAPLEDRLRALGVKSQDAA